MEKTFACKFATFCNYGSFKIEEERDSHMLKCRFTECPVCKTFINKMVYHSCIRCHCGTSFSHPKDFQHHNKWCSVIDNGGIIEILYKNRKMKWNVMMNNYVRQVTNQFFKTIEEAYEVVDEVIDEVIYDPPYHSCSAKHSMIISDNNHIELCCGVDHYIQPYNGDGIRVKFICHSCC